VATTVFARVRFTLTLFRESRPRDARVFVRFVKKSIVRMDSKCRGWPFAGTGRPGNGISRPVAEFTEYLKYCSREGLRVAASFPCLEKIVVGLLSRRSGFVFVSLKDGQPEDSWATERVKTIAFEPRAIPPDPPRTTRPSAKYAFVV
jgi:hypothetical protein